VIFARKDQVGYNFLSGRTGRVPVIQLSCTKAMHLVNSGPSARNNWPIPEIIGRVPACSAESLSVRPSACMFSRVPACLAESLHVWPSACVFGRVPTCSIESLGVQLSPWMDCRLVRGR
jgi:hypothetical protein